MNIISIIIAIILFSIIVIFHELGHFLLAKANGIKVNEFCLGLGPTLFGIQKGETKYSIKLLPFGGACIMEGEDESSQDNRAFNNKSVWARMSVVFAGPFFNFIMAFIFALIYCAIIKFAKITFITTTVGSVIMTMVAYIITMNIGLGVVNLIPLPPLDGSKIFLPILPRGAKTWFIENERIFYIIFLVIWISGIAGNMISPLISKMTSAILGIALKIFGLA